MNEPLWTDVLSALGAILTPLFVLGAGLFFGFRQSRSDQLQKVRIDYYKSLAPDLNRLMCYLTFIGTWRHDSPEDVIALKRRLDAQFYCAAPLFSTKVYRAYEDLMRLSFRTFGRWGEDAKILTSAYRRRDSWLEISKEELVERNSMFSLKDDDVISPAMLSAYRSAYDDLLAKLVQDLTISRARAQYTTSRVSMNASAPNWAALGGGNEPPQR